MTNNDAPLLTPDFIELTWVDWSIILGYVAFALVVGLYFSRRDGMAAFVYPLIN